MSKLSVCVVGATGRVGRELLKLIHNSEKFSLSKGISTQNFADLDRVVSHSDLVIDFSVAAITDKVVSACVTHQKPLLLAATGHSEEQRRSIAKAAEQIPLLLASNTSLGIAVLMKLLPKIQVLLGPDFDIEISEIHRAGKRDAPSGTALDLAKSLESSGVIFQRENARKHGEVGISSLRGGDVFGEHTIYFCGDGERLELTHRILSRETFARGALALSEKLVQLRAGRIYGPSDLT